MSRLRPALAALLVGVATTIVVLAVAILPFLSPAWIGFAQERAGAAAWTGFSPSDLRTATDAILADLVIGPPQFDVAVAGQPVLTERERGHMRDVRNVFGAFYLVAAACAVGLAAAFAITRGPARAALWRRISRAGLAIAAVTVAGGLLGLLLFDAAFALFHELFFPPGTYLFDPTTERMVQLFPQQLFIESSIGVGVVVVALGLGLWRLGAARAARATSSADATAAGRVAAGAAR